MMICKNCHVSVADGHDRCPLCKQKIKDAKNTFEEYPNYSVTTNTAPENNHLMRKILLFLSVAGGVISVFINIFTFSKVPFLWSAIAVVSLFSLWLGLITLTSKKLNIAGKALALCGLIAVIVVTVDACAGFAKWSTTYVIPFLSVALTLFITSITLTKKSRSFEYFEYFGYLLTTMFLSIIPIAIIIFPLSTVVWTSMISLIYSLLTTVWMIIFADERFKSEIKKRFHI